MPTTDDIKKFCESIDFDLLKKARRKESLTPGERIKVLAALASPTPYINGGKVDVMRNPIFDLSSVEIANMSRDRGFAAAGYTPAAIDYILHH
ncbi:hypothetical protein HYS79_01365 [Patescibacteria group bacterium]|nr:hypothetical protein [Patescibacteria group bacterium]